MNRPGPFLMSIAFLLLLTGAVVGMCRLRWMLGPGGDGTISEVTSAAGHEFKVMQKHNGSMVEPYSVGLYHRVEGGPWQWEYLDHESTRWSNADVTWNEAKRSISVYRGNDLVKEFPIAELKKPADPAGS